MLFRSKFVKYNPDDVLPLLKDFKPTNKLEVENYVTQVVPSDASVEAYKLVPIENIKPSEKITDKDRNIINKIKESIKNNEDIPPIVLEFAPVIDKGSNYTFGLADGHHRYIAYKELGYKEIPSAIITSREDYTFDTNDKNVSTLFDKSFKSISENYHAAKSDGSNPELVKAVEELIGKPTEAQPKAEPTKTFEQVAQKSGITPKNLKDLYNINRELFGLNRVKAFASAIAMDRMIGAMAKRAGVTKEQMYGKLKFEKASEQELPQGVKMQVDAWHGSPYQFERFTTEKIGTGEGAQAFGWGLYFTDLESIAKNYAKQLSALNSKIFVDGKEQIIIPDHVLYIVKDILEANGGDIEKTISDAKDRKEGYVDYLEFSQSKKQYDKFDKAIKYLEKNKEKIKLVADRIVYKVSLHKGKSPSEYTWLEWDKNATSEQKKQIANGIPNLTENEKTIISKYFTDKGNLKSVYLGQEYKTILPKYEISLLKERLMKDESRIKGSEIYHQLEKYFGIYTNRYNYLNVNNLSAVSINNYNSLLPPKEFINIISDINQNGVLGTKNKAYVNAVAHKEAVHSNKNIVYNSYSDSGVAREIMLFDLTYNSSPIESPQLLKNDINTYPTTITPDGKVIDKKILKIIPAISVTASDVIGDNYNARFAIINSWDGIVPLMEIGRAHV